MTQAKVTQQVWTAIAAEWESPDEAAKYVEYYVPFIMVMDRDLPKETGMRVLEPGCGSAALSVYMGKQRNARCVCLDFVPDMVVLARKKFESSGLEGDFIVGDMTHLPFKNGAFDLVFNQGTIEHFPRSQRQVVLDEMARVSAKYVAIFVPNRLNPIRAAAKWAQKLLRTYRWGLELPYSQWELNRRLRRAGIRVIKKGGVNFYRLFYIFGPFRLLLYPVLRFLLRDNLFRLNASNHLLNRYFGDEIFQLGVKDPATK